MKYTLIGYPLGHTLSPFLHSKLFEMSGVQARYIATPIPHEDLQGSFDKLRGFDGFNVTIPHKQSIIEMCDALEGAAAIYNSVNTVVCGERIIGHNTDGIGFRRALEHYDVNLAGDVLICGSGGAARSAAFECALAGCNVTIAVRQSDITAAQNLAGEIYSVAANPARAILLSDIVGDFNLMINATPIGMHPNPGAMVVGADIISACDAVFDMVYNPAETALLKTAADIGKMVVPGMPMLVYQACEAQKIWYGAEFTAGQVDGLIRQLNDRL